MQRIPLYHDKISSENLTELNSHRLQLDDFLKNTTKKCLIQERDENFVYDYLWSPKPGSSKIFCFFSGDILRKKNSPPVFQRWSWADNFPGHCLFISDPTLLLTRNLSLAWYLGKQNHDPLIKICETINQIKDSLGIEKEKIIMYGSSGGGFCALRTINFINKQKIVAINPQISLPLYDNKSYDKYLEQFCGGISREQSEFLMPSKVNLANLIEKIDNQKIIYVQNTHDKHHLEVHFELFCNSLGVNKEHDINNDKFCKILFNHPGGHGKAETQEAFNEILNCLEN